MIRTQRWMLILIAALLASLLLSPAVLADDDEEYEFRGTVEALPSDGLIGDWIVSGRTVHVFSTTEIKQKHGPVAIGAEVEVKGQLLDDGSVNAEEIEVKSRSDGPSEGHSVEFYGTIEALPSGGLIGEWTVSGRTVHVSAETYIEQKHGPVTVGAYVEVKGYRQDDGSIAATKIEVKANSGDDDRPSYIKFYGTITELPDTPNWIGNWTIDGQTVHVGPGTRIEQEHGVIVVGAYVEVKGWMQADGTIEATKIEVKGNGEGRTEPLIKFYGTVQQLPPDGLLGTWIVSGRTVHVSDTTRIEQEHGSVQVGSYVEVYGWFQPDQSVNAAKIEVKASRGRRNAYQMVKFYGTVEQLPQGGLIGEWIVSGRIVRVTELTRIDQRHGPITVGTYVEVKGWPQGDGTIKAAKIEVEKGANGGRRSVGFVKFYGIVEDLPASGFIGDWVVNGETVHVTSQTRIEQEHGTIRLGAMVEVKGTRQADGTITAYKIEVKR